MLVPFGEKHPQAAEDVFIAPGVFVIGDVSIGPGSSIWFNSVLRGDIDHIRIGTGTNIQDGCILHVGYDCPTIVGNRVVVGHGVQVHGAVVEDQCLIGMGAILLNHSRVESGAIVAAGAVVPEGMVVPSRQVVAGVPARVIRSVSDEEFARIAVDAERYRELAASYRQSIHR